MKTPPISEQELQPKIISNIQYVNGIEEMEKIELKPNEIALRFDNNVSSFYIRSRDKHGEYSPIKIYFYEDFADYVTYEQFINWNGAYLKIAVEKGYFTFDYIIELIEMYKGWMP